LGKKAIFVLTRHRKSLGQSGIIALDVVIEFCVVEGSVVFIAGTPLGLTKKLRRVA
jgi:hypothetical protein